MEREHVGAAVLAVFAGLVGLSVSRVHSVSKLITSSVSRRRRKMYCGHPRLCVCLCVCPRPHAYTIVRTRMLLGGVVGDAPSCALLCGFAISAGVALLWQHYGNAWQSPAVGGLIRQAHRRPHAARTAHACGVRRRLPSPAIKSAHLLHAPFHFVHTAGVL